MKLRCSKKQSHGLTLLEVLVVISLLAVIAVLLLPALAASRIKSERLSCVSNLKVIVMAPHIWEGDHGDLYPVAVSCTNGGALEQTATGNVAAVFQVMSNLIVTPELLICPADKSRVEAMNFSTGFSAKNISYFINVDASEANPQMLLMGDDNFEIDGVPVKSGILELTNSQQISWTNERHKRCGNLAITDGSVQQVSRSGLQEFWSLATNRLAIP
jgi:prepilin-type N-terminal cleavage/methylation domain-containing protein